MSKVYDIALLRYKELNHQSLWQKFNSLIPLTNPPGSVFSSGRNSLNPAYSPNLRLNSEDSFCQVIDSHAKS